MIKRFEGDFRGKDEFELFYQTWTSEGSRGTLVLTHGLGEHSDCYNRLAQGLLPGDWDIWAWDLRGHGRSEGKRGTVGAFSDYCEDLKLFVQLATLKNPGRPIALLGHSMGGLVTAASVVRFGDMSAKCLCLSSPLMGIAVEVPKIKESLGRMAASIVPHLTLHNEIRFEDLTHDPAVIAEYEKDVLRHDRISTSLFVEMVSNAEFVLNNAGRIKLPFLLQQAGTDRIVSRKNAELLIERAGSSKKEMKIYEDFYHEIFNEVGRDVVFSDLKAWLKGFA